MENNKDVKRLYFLVTVLAIMVVLLGGFVVYKEFIKDDKNTSSNTNDNTKKNDVTCNDCVTSIDFEKTQQAKILLGNKIKTVKLEEPNATTKNLMIDENNIQSEAGGLSHFDYLYVINNEVIMVITGGSDIRSNEYDFYDANLNKISVDMALDKNYPKSMEALDAEKVTVNNNTIIIEATRLTHSYELVTEKDSYMSYLCEFEGYNATYNGTHKGELVSAKYEISYLGNGKFSKPVMVTGTDKYIDETICK